MKNGAVVSFVLGTAIMVGAAIGVGQSAPESKGPTGSEGKSGTQKTDAHASSRGAELFQTHCGRCHKPPEDLTPRVSPAVVAHMRTRALLSRKDEQEILKFLKP